MGKDIFLKKILLLTPFIGICIYIILYMASAKMYPGGSDVFPQREGFDWVNNFWCDLTDHITESGEINPARPVAIIAMAIFCFSIAILSYFVGKYFQEIPAARLIFYFTAAAMIFANFAYSEFHDYSVYLAGLLGIYPLVMAFYGLYKRKLKQLFIIGAFAMFFLILNFFIYKTRIFYIALPLIQKFTFLSFIFWISMLNFKIIKNQKT